jgi:hypothetical protein
MAVACGFAGLAVCGLAECVRHERNLGHTVFTARNTAAVVWLVVVLLAWLLLRPASLMDGVTVLGLMSCLVFLLVLGVLALTRDVCRAIRVRNRFH